MHPPRAHSISPHIPQNLTLSSQTYNKRPQLFYKSCLYISQKHHYYTIDNWELLWHILSICALPKGQACRVPTPLSNENQTDDVCGRSPWWHCLPLYCPSFEWKAVITILKYYFIHGKGQEFPFCGSILHTSFFRSGQLQYDKLWDLNGCCVAVLQHK